MNPEEKIAQLTEEIAYLKGDKFLDSDCGAALAVMFDLTESEARILAVLVQRETASKEAVYAALYLNKPDRDLKTVDVLIHKLRRKLKRNGIEIATIHGRGWHLLSMDRMQIRQRLGEAAAMRDEAMQWIMTHPRARPPLEDVRRKMVRMLVGFRDCELSLACAIASGARTPEQIIERLVGMTPEQVHSVVHSLRRKLPDDVKLSHRDGSGYAFVDTQNEKGSA